VVGQDNQEQKLKYIVMKFNVLSETFFGRLKMCEFQKQQQLLCKEFFSFQVSSSTQKDFVYNTHGVVEPPLTQNTMAAINFSV